MHVRMRRKRRLFGKTEKKDFPEISGIIHVECLCSVFHSFVNYDCLGRTEVGSAVDRHESQRLSASE